MHYNSRSQTYTVKGEDELTVFRRSRYAKSRLYYNATHDIVYMTIPEPIFSALITDIIVPFIEGDRLDSLAKKYYNDPQLDWVILQANPQYYSSEDINAGDLIVIPVSERVMSNV